MAAILGEYFAKNAKQSSLDWRNFGLADIQHLQLETIKMKTTILSLIIVSCVVSLGLAQAQTGDQYIQQQLNLAKSGNYWAKYNLWEAYARGKHGVSKNQAEADKWLPQLVMDVHLAKFEPTGGFNPRTPKEMLNKFHESCRLQSARDSLGGASFFRTKKQGDKLIGSFLTDSPDKFKAALEKNADLKLISIEKITVKTFLEHEASKQESL